MNKVNNEFYAIGTTVQVPPAGFRTIYPKSTGWYEMDENGGNLTMVNGGNIGAGTASPTARIHAVGSTTTSAGSTILAMNSVGTTLLRVRDDGFVGIGIDSPTQKLHVNSAAAGGVLFNLNDVMFDVPLSGSVGQLRFSYGSEIDFMMNPYPSAYNTSFRFRSRPAGTSGENGIEHSVMAQINGPGGNLIGEALNIGTTGATNTGTIIGKIIRKSSFTNPNAVFYPLIVLDGNAGVGTSTPTAKFHAVGSTTTEAGTTILATDLLGSSLFKVRDDGNVGIGTTNPTSRLDIIGPQGYNQLRLETSYTPSSSSDSNGNVGDIAWDESYIYWKTSGNGWMRATGATF